MHFRENISLEAPNFTIRLEVPSAWRPALDKTYKLNRSEVALRIHKQKYDHKRYWAKLDE